MESKLSFGHLAALFTVVNWGTTFIATKVLLEAFTPLEILIFRFVLGYVALAAACPKRLKVGDWKKEGLLAAAGLTGVCLYYLLENIALTFSTASNVGVIVSASPLFAALFSLALSRGKERPGWRFLLGFLLSMGGICLISYTGNALALDLRGDLLAVIAAMVWAVYSLLTKKIGSFGWNVILTTRRIFFYGILFMIPAAAFLPFRWDLGRLGNGSYLAMLLYLGLGACAMCFVTWNYAIKTLGPVKTMVYIYLVPVITVICSALILHETVTLRSVAGTALTLAGLVLSQWDSLKLLWTGRTAAEKEDI